MPRPLREGVSAGGGQETDDLGGVGFFRKGAASKNLAGGK